MHDVGHIVLADHNDSLYKRCKEESKTVDDCQVFETDGVFDLEISTWNNLTSKVVSDAEFCDQ